VTELNERFTSTVKLLFLYRYKRSMVKSMKLYCM